MSEQEIRKNWHDYYIKNKHKFTDIKLDIPDMDKGMIYVPKNQEKYQRRYPQEAADIQYKGQNLWSNYN